MALGTLLGAVGSAAVSYGASKLFGSNSSKAPMAALGVNPSMVSKDQVNAGLNALDKPTFTGFDAGGLSARLGANGVSVTSSNDRLLQLGKLAALFPQQASEIAALKARVAPGMSELRAARLGEIENSRARAVGNLRDNLQKRRVLGSSFAQDSLANAESEFAQQKSKVAGESFMQELEATNQLMTQEYEARAGEFQTWLGEMGLQASLAAELSAQFQSEANKNMQLKASLLAELANNGAAQSGANMRTLADLSAKSDAASGKFIGDLIAPVASAFGSEVTSRFS